MYELEGTGRDGSYKHFEKPWAMTTGGQPPPLPPVTLAGATCPLGAGLAVKPIKPCTLLQ